MNNEYTGWLWQNGQFGVSKRNRLPETDTVRPPAQTEEVAWWGKLLTLHSLSDVLFAKRIESAMREKDVSYLHPMARNTTDFARFLGVVHPSCLKNLGLSNLSNSNKSVRRGTLGITAHGRKLVANSALVLEREAGKERLAFLTCTLPALGRAEMERIHKNWSVLLNYFRIALQRLLQSRGLPTDIVGVTEIQSSRLERRGEFALHIHWLFVGRSSRYLQWGISKQEYADLWSNAIATRLGREFDGQRCPSTRVESVTKSASGYLAKYMSKGSEQMAVAIDAGFGDWLPRSWYTCTKSLRRRVLDGRVRLHGESALTLIELVEGGADICEWKKQIKVEWGGREIPVGYAGRLRSCEIGFTSNYLRGINLVAQQAVKEHPLW